MAESVALAVSGARGRMGRIVTELAAEDPAFRVVGGIDRDAEGDVSAALPLLVTPSEAGDLLKAADVLIDFSAPEFLESILTRHAEMEAGCALVVGTTGLGPPEERLIEAASEKVGVLTAANFSVGVNLLIALTQRSAAALGAGYDIEIVEVHHRRKEDAPSGTALALGRAAAAGRKLDLEAVRKDGRSGRPGARPADEIGFHALRGGDVAGDHCVHFIGELERIELTHRASDRALFGAGALRAAAWIAGRVPGRYSMRDVLGL
ncbi:MAG: 4-hydroxy-tetrahydrodipicolinate reductase [Gemmatimonadota bacterium]